MRKVSDRQYSVACTVVDFSPADSDTVVLATCSRVIDGYLHSMLVARADLALLEAFA